jgi:hypothetical protein
MVAFFFYRSHAIVDYKDGTGDGSSGYYGDANGDGWGSDGAAITDGDGMSSGDDLSEHHSGDSSVRSPERDTHPPEYDCSNNGNGFGVALEPSMECGMWVMDI